jgi:hypothetical protein
MFISKRSDTQDALVSPEIIEEIISDLDLSEDMQKICVLVHLLTNKQTPYRTSFTFLVQVLQKIRRSYNGEIFLIEKLYSDSKPETLQPEEKAVLDTLRVEFHAFSKDDVLQVENSFTGENKLFDSFFVPRLWVEADLRIIFANASLHKHHAVQYFHGCESEFALMLSVSVFDWRNIKRNEAVGVYRDQLSDMVYELNGQEVSKAYGVLDAREIPLSNEHIFVTRTKKLQMVSSGWDLREVDQTVYVTFGLQ